MLITIERRKKNQSIQFSRKVGKTERNIERKKKEQLRVNVVLSINSYRYAGILYRAFGEEDLKIESER